jgi:BirA family biotin operon repressor/biotin-[acetyl-CoA-carboxylase] ligase
MKDFQHPLFDEIYCFDKIESTNLKAKKLIRTGEARGNFLVISRIQSGGIGRNRNLWFSPDGGIWMSVGLYGLTVSSNLTIFTGICIHKALTELFPEIKSNLKIKWPNDIYLNNKKLCGILSSNLQAEKYHLLGIGLNSNVCEIPLELKDIAISLRKELDYNIDNKVLVSKIFNNFASDLPDFIEGKLDVKYYNEHSLLKGRNIELDTDFDKFSGIAKGINKSGALLIELKPGMIQPFYAGTVISWN